jgi:hypothetical protein
MTKVNASMTLIVLKVRLVLTSTVRIHVESLMIHAEQMLIVKPLFTELYVSVQLVGLEILTENVSNVIFNYEVIVFPLYLNYFCLQLSV